MKRILEQILLSPKKTKFHDDVLGILSLHLDPSVPLPRLKMIDVSVVKLLIFENFRDNCLALCD